MPPHTVQDESRILKPRDAKIDDEDEWPQFTLTNAQVFNAALEASNTEDALASLLVANDRTPLTVTGELKRLAPSEQHLLQQRNIPLPAAVRLGNVQHFAYGEYDTGEIAFWAAGAAGWFEIKPSRAYRSILNSMTEAIGMLYFMADLWRESQGGKKAKNRQMDADTVFEKYAEDPDYHCSDAREARRAFRRHRRVLGELMNQGKEGIAWKKLNIYKWMRSGETSGLRSTSSNFTLSQRELALISQQDTSASEDDNEVQDEDGDISPNSPTSSQSDSAMTNPSRLASKGKSALRPTGPTSKSAQKAAQKAEKAASKRANLSRDGPTPYRDPEAAALLGSASDVEMLDGDDRSSRAGSAKRARPDDEPERSRKRTKKSSDQQPTPESEDPPAEPAKLPLRYDNRRLPARFQTSPNAPTNTTRPPRGAHLAAPPTNPKLAKPVLPRQPPEYSATLRTDPLPSSSHENGTWTCAHPGCTHRIHDADSSDASRLVREHHREHAYAAQAELDADAVTDAVPSGPLHPRAQGYLEMVRKERLEGGERGKLATGNLEKRIRLMTAGRLGGSTTTAVAQEKSAMQPVGLEEGVVTDPMEVDVDVEVDVEASKSTPEKKKKKAKGNSKPKPVRRRY
ncbi:MAG: hypothetical protein M1828_000215 [Chrysothrix sp. TS-e1954]|nr:MAG: hypothetical protein M1828_000215 [Chrysothrix sp. TS-e1954]